MRCDWCFYNRGICYKEQDCFLEDESINCKKYIPSDEKRKLDEYHKQLYYEKIYDRYTRW